MEFTPIPQAALRGCGVIVFDSLFWMWPHLPFDLSDVDLYLCQNFLGVAERRAALPETDAARVRIASPLTLSRWGSWRGGDTVVLNFGGMDNPFAGRPELLQYAACMTALAADVCRSRDLRLAVYGRSWIMDDLRRQFPEGSLSFATLPPEEFVAHLETARCLVTAPGLEVLYEAFTAGVPTFLLPPQNNSQYYQARQLLAEVSGLPGLLWQQLVAMNERHCESDSPREVITELLRGADRLRHTPSAWLRFREALDDFIGRPTEEHLWQQTHQHQFLEEMQRSADLKRQRRDEPGRSISPASRPSCSRGTGD
jgi:hypothetical protein